MGSHWLDVGRELIFGHSGRKPMPNLDGAWRPNELLEDAPLLGPRIEAPEDIAIDDQGRVFIASRNRVVVLDESAPGGCRDHAIFDGSVTALAFGQDVGLLACVTGEGVVIVEEGGSRTLSALKGETSFCPMGVAVDRGGDIYVTVGSTRRKPEEWSRDLMEQGTSGKVVRYSAQRKTVDVLAENLAFPYGVAIRESDGAVLVAEAWRHRLLVLSSYERTSKPREAIQNLPGYPSRLSLAGGGGWWVSFLALRTHLVEFVLREDGFREQMIKTIHPEHWIAPSLNSREALLQPLQLGGLRNHGVKKPWAPPRSYGLVVRFDENFEPLASIHSRSNGSRHGPTGVIERKDRILVAVKGADCIVSAPLTGEP
jgi:sugar lactone lactonase YvrE